MTDPDRTRRDHELPHATLGTQRATPFTYTPELLEAVPVSTGRPYAGQQAWISLACLRFTSLCPVTGQPDWAELTVNYITAEHLVESKSLKEYLNSFRMHGDFHEDVCRIICDDLVACIAPRYLEVLGCFDSRGSIAIWPYVQWAAADDRDALALRDQRRASYAPGAWMHPRAIR